MNISIKSAGKKDFENMLNKKNPFVNEILENHVIITGFEEFVDKVIKAKWWILSGVWKLRKGWN